MIELKRRSETDAAGMGARDRGYTGEREIGKFESAA